METGELGQRTAAAQDEVGSERGTARTLLSRLVLPADDWARQGEGDRQRPSLLSIILVACIASILIAALLAFKLWHSGTGQAGLLAMLLMLLAGTAVMLGYVMRQVSQFLLEPMAQVYAWSVRMCNGDLSARIPTEGAGEFAKLTFSINRLSEALDRLANEMDDLVWSQTERLQHQKESLETLYEITAALNAAGTLSEALPRCVERLSATLGNARVRLRLKSVGDFAAGERPGVPGSPLQVELQFNAEVLGVLSAELPVDPPGGDDDARRLLESVARQISMAAARARLAEQTLNLSLMRERTMLAHELHDSLAQTLASVRLRARMLPESLPASEAAKLRGELENIDAIFDEANRELRELIVHFRAPVDESGLKPALEHLLDRFRENSVIDYRLHSNDPHRTLPAASELQVTRIVSEALTNVEKHSHANMARVQVNHLSGGRCRVLIEDDGVGMEDLQGVDEPGEHVGISVMHDRARMLGGTLSIESEPGEGVQVTLEFNTDDGDDESPPGEALADGAAP